MITFRRIYCPNCCYIPGMLCISAMVCENPKCGHVHGFTLSIGVLWWGLEVEWLFKIKKL